MHLIHCYHVRDKLGNVAYAVSDGSTDTIFLSVWSPRGPRLTFCGEGRDLKDWCDEYGLEYRHQILEVEIPKPFDSE